MKHFSQLLLITIRSINSQISLVFLETLNNGFFRIEQLHPFSWELVSVIVVLIWEIDVVELVEIEVGCIVVSETGF